LEIDKKLDEILEKLAISKVDNSFLIGFSILSILFGLSNLVLREIFHRQVLLIGAVIYFLFSFYIGYFRGVMRDNWGFRIFGWIWLSLSFGVIITVFIVLLILEKELVISPTFPYGLFLIFESISFYFLIQFIKDMDNVIPNFKNHILLISPVLKHYLKPFVNPVIYPNRSKPIYAAILTFFLIGVILMVLGIFPIDP